MKVDMDFNDLCEEIANYDADIWNNPVLWTKKEWHMYDLFLYYQSFNWWKRRKAKRLMKKAIKEKKKQSNGDVKKV